MRRTHGARRAAHVLARPRHPPHVARAERRPAGPALADEIAVRSYAAADAERVHALLDEAYAGWDTDYVRRPHADWLAFMTAHDDFDPLLS